MARLAGFQREAFDAWVKTRPPEIQALCERLPPDRLYLLKSSGHRVTLRSYCENGTVTVNVTGEYNFLTFDRYVFGIKPEDLTECDFPPSDHPIGTVFTEEKDVEAFINVERAARGLPPREAND